MVTEPLPSTRGLWIRWSWRDLRGHWVAMVAIALVLAIGMGVFAGLGSTAAWRRASNDASFEAFGMHDLRVELSPGTFVEQGKLLAAAQGIDAASSIDGITERLVVDNQVDASTSAQSILVAARVVGMDFDTDPVVDGLYVRDGRLPDPAEPPSAVLELKFADHWDLPPTGTVALAGGREIAYVGLGMTPEDYFYEGPEGTIFSEGELAPVYMELDAAQELAGRTQQVNDLVVTLREGSDLPLLAAEVTSAIDGLGVSATVSTQDDAYAVRVLYDDIENDQRTWNAISALVLGAASLAAFNLVSRIVEAQRREIGIGKALGVHRWKLAIRPMLVGLQVAVLGTLAGVGVGLLVGAAMEDLLRSFLPLPIWHTEFQYGTFARAAALGLIAPIVASALPVWRAVRVEPIKAIRTGHLTAKASRLTDWTSRIRLPGSSLAHMPVRNIFRTPRRTTLTVLGVGAAITALVGVLGMLDSFGRTIDQAAEELTKGDDDRIVVQLDTFYPVDSAVVSGVDAAVSDGHTDAGLRLPATTRQPDGDDLDLLLELVDYETATWVPTVKHISAEETGDSGILLAQKAADDLGLSAGDPVLVRHPVRDGPFSYSLTETEFILAGIHENPLRSFAFLDISQAGLFGLDGSVNVMNAYPGGDATRNEVQRALFGLPGVASSQAVARISESFDEALAQFIGFLFIAAGAVLILAFLIAFNSTRISIDERRRDHATMRAFGLPVRSVMGVVVKESILVGIASTVVGVVAGSLFLGWMLNSIMSTTLPDLSVDMYLSPTTILLALGVGVVAVATAPLFLVRRLRRMNIPDTLRVME